MDKKEIRTIKDAAEYRKIRANRPAPVPTERKRLSCLQLRRVFRKLICEEGKSAESV
jgi:ribosomal protein S10